MPTLPSGKYQLKSLHEEIALFDRKLAHAQSFETFSDEDQRNTAVAKLNSKRGLLVRKAQQMIDEGVEFNEVDRPKSLRPEGAAEAVVPAAIIEQQAEPALAAASDPMPSPYAGTSLDSQVNLV
ncbi:MAG TPA: hypothetical protein VIM60_10190, partial [Edaphobacter sp.]